MLTRPVWAKYRPQFLQRRTVMLRSTQVFREIAYDHREPTPTLEDAVCGMAGTVAAICALCEDEDSEVSDLARELYYSSLLLQELVEWYQSRRQEQENYEEEYEQYHGFDMTMM